MGLAQLRRAPRELLPDKGPGAAQARAPGRAKQNWTLLRARRGTLALNQLLLSRGSVRPQLFEENPTSGCQDV